MILERFLEGIKETPKTQEREGRHGVADRGSEAGARTGGLPGSPLSREPGGGRLASSALRDAQAAAADGVRGGAERECPRRSSRTAQEEAVLPRTGDHGLLYADEAELLLPTFEEGEDTQSEKRRRGGDGAVADRGASSSRQVRQFR